MMIVIYYSTKVAAHINCILVSGGFAGVYTRDSCAYMYISYDTKFWSEKILVTGELQEIRQKFSCPKFSFLKKYSMYT